MAALLGHPSYAHYKAADTTLAGTPEAAEGFLKQLAADIKPLADLEVRQLKRVKRKASGDAGTRSCAMCEAYDWVAWTG